MGLIQFNDLLRSALPAIVASSEGPTAELRIAPNWLKLIECAQRTKEGFDE